MSVLGIVLVASLVLGTVMFLKVRDQNRLDDNRRDALTAAQQFALRMDAFNGADIDAYIKSVEPMLTTKEKADFAQQFGEFKQVYEASQKAQQQAANSKHQPTKKSPVAAGGVGVGKIQLAGVTDVDSDSATVLVAHDSSIPGTSQSLHSRWTVSMRKIGSSWLVDSFVPVS